MSEAKWKAHERAIAKALGGMRLPNTGRRSPDIISPGWVAEVKVRRTLPQWLLKAVSQAQEGAMATGRLPLVVLVHAPGKGRKAQRLAILPLEVLSNLVGSEGDKG
jgi:hypothetical protein